MHEELKIDPETNQVTSIIQTKTGESLIPFHAIEIQNVTSPSALEESNQAKKIDDLIFLIGVYKKRVEKTKALSVKALFEEYLDMAERILR